MVKRVWIEVPDWVDEVLVRKRVGGDSVFSILCSGRLSSERLGITELKEDISIDESILGLREKEIILHRHQKPFIDRCLPTDETHDRLGLYDKVYASIVQ